MSKDITGPRALGAFKLATLETREGRAGQVAALCAVARRSFEVHGRVNLLSWIWVQQSPDGTALPAILSVELTAELDEARHDAFEARVARACALGEALAVGTVSGHQSIQVLFESHAGSELHSASILCQPDPIHPAAPRRVLDTFRAVAVDRAPERFSRFLHARTNL